MDYIYEAIDRAKEAIMKVFKEKEDKYKEVFEIIDKRWECQLHWPLHAARHYLNLEYVCSDTYSNIYGEVVNGLFEAMERFVSNAVEQDKITTQLSIYRKAEGLFGRNVTIIHRIVLFPAEWWECYGANTPELQKFAIKCLALLVVLPTVSAIGVYLSGMMPMIRLTPISLTDIDDNNEWLMDRMDEESDNEEDELIFDGDDLTWDVIARASRAEEPEYCTRGKKYYIHGL
ncbi:uncharacterized protein LOC122050710 [Zingiber officinale]|uniref:uncharacterized protein LOC122050710 n=1 Tax=Zingiber officinale TaxID=94328 RepID=UPI001C4DD4DB|nr:uncharacterized protein LOC122050710 [Zingiber officinale]